VSPDGKQFVTTSPDRRIRVFWFVTGKLRRTYDESLEVTCTMIPPSFFVVMPMHTGSSFRCFHPSDLLLLRDTIVDADLKVSSHGKLVIQVAQDLQRSDAMLYKLDAVDFARRMAIEKEIEKTEGVPPTNAIFDESSNFLLYPTLLGIKVK